MRIPDCISVDFETHPIFRRPQYPPKPVSVAIHWPGDSTHKLMAWGHEGGDNNCTEREARGELRKAYNSKYPLLFQNAMFDLDTAETHWELPLPTYDKWHDTLFLIFLDNPHAESLGLKPSAERLLGMKPEEQDKMYDWIIQNVPEARQKPSTAGAYIWKCPYRIVKPYHKGDLVRTERIFKLLYPRIVDAGMRDAYERELKLMPILLRNSRTGMRLDMEGMQRDVVAMKQGIERAADWVRKRLKTPELNLDSPVQLANALMSSGVVTDFKLTAKGNRSTSKKTLTIDKFKDKRVYQALQYQGQMGTSVTMFIDPWLELGAETGLIYPNWSQVRAPKGDSRDTSGARSGRIICSKPNFLNLPKKWKRAAVTGYRHPDFIKGLVELPFVRKYALPPKGKRWGRRDMNQQEVRLFAHFEEGPVMAAFLSDPRFDVHEGVRKEEEEALLAAALRDEFDRDSAKTTVFGAFYGQGLTGLMEALRLRDPEDKDVGKAIHRALHSAVPSIAELSNALKELAYKEEPVRTWGGRLYYCEEPKYVEKFGRNMTFEYKLISYLIQGSGADVTKEAIVRYYDHPKRTEDMIVTVYDEINVSLPKSAKGTREQMRVLKECIESLEIDVPMVSDGEVGESWGALAAYVD